MFEGTDSTGGACWLWCFVAALIGQVGGSFPNYGKESKSDASCQRSQAFRTELKISSGGSCWRSRQSAEPERRHRAVTLVVRLHRRGSSAFPSPSSGARTWRRAGRLHSSALCGRAQWNPAKEAHWAASAAAKRAQPNVRCCVCRALRAGLCAARMPVARPLKRVKADLQSEYVLPMKDPRLARNQKLVFLQERKQCLP